MKSSLKVLKNKAEKAQQYFEEGNAYHFTNSAKAMEYYKKALTVDPYNVSAHKAIYNLLLKQGQYEESLNYLYKLIKLNHSEAEYYWDIYFCLKKLDKEVEAMECCLKFIQRNANVAYKYILDNVDKLNSYCEKVELGFYKTFALYELGLDSEAEKVLESHLSGCTSTIEWCDKFLTLKPNAKYLYYYKGLAFYKTGNKKEAEGCFSIAIEHNFTDAKAYSNMGYHLKYMGNHIKAEESFCKALDIGFNRDINYLYTNDLHGVPYLIDGLGGYTKATLYYRISCELRDLGNSSKSIEGFDKAINADPQQAIFFKGKADILSSLGAKEEALKYYNQALAKCNHNTYKFEIYFEIATIMRELGREIEAKKHYLEAIKLNDYGNSRYFDKALDDNPEDALSLFFKGITELRGGLKYTYKGVNPVLRLPRGELHPLYKAIKLDPNLLYCYDALVAFRPEDALRHFFKGVALLTLGKNEEAVIFFDNAIKKDPILEDAYISKGQALSALGKYMEALECYDKAIDLCPVGKTYSSKGRTLQVLGKYMEALECYDKAIRLNSLDPSVYFAKGETLKEVVKQHKASSIISKQYNNILSYWKKSEVPSESKLTEEADKCFDKVISLGASDAPTLYKTGCALIELDLGGKAVVCFEKAMMQEASDVTLLRKLGNAFRDLKLNGKAEASFNKALSCSPPQASIFYEIGTDFNAIGAQSKARECYYKAISLNPTNANLLHKLGKALHELKDYDRALECYDKAIEIFTEDDSIYYDKGNALSELGRVAEALECYNKAGELFPYNHNTFYKKGFTLLALGRHEHAVVNFDKAIQLEAKHRDSYLGKIYALKILGRDAEAEACESKLKEVDHVSNAGSSILSNMVSMVAGMKWFQSSSTAIEATADQQTLSTNNPTPYNAESEYIPNIQSSNEGQATQLLSETHSLGGMDKKQEDNATEQALQLATYKEALGELTLVIERLREKVESDRKLNQEEKKLIEEGIGKIEGKIKGLAYKSEVESITEEMTKIISEEKITKQRLNDLEADIDDSLARQKQTDGLISKIKAKVKNERQIKEHDKQAMMEMINNLTEKVYEIKSKDNVDAFIQEMNKLLSKSVICEANLKELTDSAETYISGGTAKVSEGGDKEGSIIVSNATQNIQLTIKDRLLIAAQLKEAQELKAMKRRLEEIEKQMQTLKITEVGYNAGGKQVKFGEQEQQYSSNVSIEFNSSALSEDHAKLMGEGEGISFK
jgi:tetratricopeptide (TPR) repeat protein